MAPSSTTIPNSGPVYPVQVKSGGILGTGIGSASVDTLAGNIAAEHKDWLLLVAEFIFVVILAMIADGMPSAQTAIVAFLLGLWLLWLTLGGGSGIITGSLAALGFPTGPGVGPGVAGSYPKSIGGQPQGSPF